MNRARSAIRNTLSELDAWSGSLFDLQCPGYMENLDNSGASTSVLTAEDWGRARKRGTPSWGDGTEFDSDVRYLQYIFSAESMNVIDALSLARAFDFARYKSILELGCGAMAQAYVMHHLHPKIRYVATDLDPYVIERCASLAALDGIEKRVLDVRSAGDKEIPYGDFDLVTSWGMEYALEDHQLTRLFGQIRGAGVSYLLCSATAVGLLKYFRYLLSARRQYSLLKQGRARLTGWQRSPRRLAYLGRSAGLNVRMIGRFGYHFCILFTSAD